MHITKCDFTVFLKKFLFAFLVHRKGLSFLPEVKGLKPFSFLSVEAILWITQHVDGVTSKEQAIQLCQVSSFFIEERKKARGDTNGCAKGGGEKRAIEAPRSNSHFFSQGGRVR